MQIFLAGTSVSVPEKQPKLQRLFKAGHKLHSYYHIPILENKWFMKNIENKVSLFLDSGAFSAWAQGVKIDIQKYITFIKENENLLEVYANLDIIGVNGAQPNRLTAKLTLKNQRIMEKAGLTPLPCFHYGEPFEYLDYYVENYDYLALGVAGNKGKGLIPWLNECFTNHICDKNGMPKIKIHGFAVTSVGIMIRYPFYSVDSTSWVVTSRMGSVFIPPFNYKTNSFDYTVTPNKIMVSTRSPGAKEKGKHINNIPKGQRDVYLEYFHSKGYKLGRSKFRTAELDHVLQDNERWAQSKKDVKGTKRMLEILIEEGICNRYELRDELNIIYFLDLEKSRPQWPWALKINNCQKGLF